MRSLVGVVFSLLLARTTQGSTNVNFAEWIYYDDSEEGICVGETMGSIYELLDLCVPLGPDSSCMQTFDGQTYAYTVYEGPNCENVDSNSGFSFPIVEGGCDDYENARLQVVATPSDDLFVLGLVKSSCDSDDSLVDLVRAGGNELAGPVEILNGYGCRTYVPERFMYNGVEASFKLDFGGHMLIFESEDCSGEAVVTDRTCAHREGDEYFVVMPLARYYNFPTSAPTQSPTKEPTIRVTLLPRDENSTAPSSAPTTSPTASNGFSHAISVLMLVSAMILSHLL